MSQYEREYNTMWYSPLIATDTIIFLFLCCTIFCLKVAINILILILNLKKGWKGVQFQQEQKISQLLTY